MPNDALLDSVPLWAVFAATGLSIAFAAECGYRLGRARARRPGKEGDSPVGGMVAAELGLLAFLLAFTFGIAASHFDDRRQALLNEVNAIGTVDLRAAMLPEPQRAQVRRLVRDYAGLRVLPDQGDGLEQAIRRSEELHAQLWSEAVTAAASDPRSIPVGLFVEALNEVIDLHLQRMTAGMRARIPLAIWIVLFAVAMLSFVTMGYQGGLSRSSRSPAVVVVALTFATVIWLVADLDRPGEGLLRVNQQPILELLDSMNAANR